MNDATATVVALTNRDEGALLAEKDVIFVHLSMRQDHSDD